MVVMNMLLTKVLQDTLDAGDTATDVFTYTVSDGNDGTDTATLTFTILGVDDDPVGVNDTGLY
jgi:VCBS repeat-containing protein